MPSRYWIHALAQGNHIRVVMLPAKPRRFPHSNKEAQRNAFDPVGHNRLAVARSHPKRCRAQIHLSRHRLSHRPDQKAIIHRLFGVRAKSVTLCPRSSRSLESFLCKEPRVSEPIAIFMRAFRPSMARQIRPRQSRLRQP